MGDWFGRGKNCSDGLEMFFIGIDLSGPSNHADTAMVWAKRVDGKRLVLDGVLVDASDLAILERIEVLGRQAECVIGIDAPLSYNDGGGFRLADAELQRRITAIGMKRSSIMPPTLTNMSYLTLRGMGLSRAISLLQCPHALRSFETHPGAVFGLHGAPLPAVLDYKKNVDSRLELLAWLTSQSFDGLTSDLANSSHLVAACGAMYAAWKWANLASQWCYPALPPQHPFDFAC
jgi:predicted nuclease with RNAse H fold